MVYFPDGQQTLANYPAGTTASSPTAYVYASYIDEVVMRSGGSGTRYYHRNRQYSITALTDGNGSIAERYAYTAYGQVTIADASGSEISNSAISNRYTYTGREWDECLSLYHYRARMHHPVAGRFVSRDPIGFDGSEWCLYEYADSMPTSAMDPTGKTTLCGTVTLECKVGPVEVIVSGDSDRARQILQFDPDNPTGSGCVTFPQGIECSGSCDWIKTTTAESIGGRRVPILEHEGCHACLMKDNLRPRRNCLSEIVSWLPYVGSWGAHPDGCVGNEVDARTNW